MIWRLYGKDLNSITSLNSVAAMTIGEFLSDLWQRLMDIPVSAVLRAVGMMVAIAAGGWLFFGFIAGTDFVWKQLLRSRGKDPEELDDLWSSPVVPIFLMAVLFYLVVLLVAPNQEPLEVAAVLTPQHAPRLRVARL
jgi:hypothetical protein